MTWPWVAVIFITGCFLLIAWGIWSGDRNRRQNVMEAEVVDIEDKKPLRNIKSVHDVNGPTLEERVTALEQWKNDRDTGVDPSS